MAHLSPRRSRISGPSSIVTSFTPTCSCRPSGSDRQRIALMQGRLLPPEGGSIQGFPRDRWREEFALAGTARIDAIEWIYDEPGADVNPLATDTGLAEMRALSGQHGIAVVSLCADYFLERPFVRVGLDSVRDLTAHLIWLIG